MRAAVNPFPLGVLLLVSIAPAPAAAPQEVIIADKIRIAFYEKAPPEMEVSMRAAIDRECASWTVDSTARSDVSSDEPDQGWVCSAAPMFFVREVNILGYRGEDGFVCQGRSDWTFFPASMFEGEEGEETCISVWYDSDAAAHDITLE